MTRMAMAAMTVALAVGLAGAAAAGEGIAGTWTAKIHVPDTPMGELNLDYTYEFEVEDGKLVGTATLAEFMGQGPIESAIEDIEVDGDKITFVEQMNMQGQVMPVPYEGIIEGDEIRFTRQVGDFPKEKFVAKRKMEQ